MKKYRYIAFVLIILSVFVLLCACTDEGSGEIPDTSYTGTTLQDVTVTPSDSTSGDTQSEPVSEPDTVTDTADVTESDTQTQEETTTITETTTEAPEITVDPEKITFDADSGIKDYLTVNRADYTLLNGEESNSTLLKLTPVDNGNTSRPSVRIRYADYIRAHGSEPVSTDKCRYVVIRFRVENGSSNTLYLHYTCDGESKKLRIPAATYNPDSTDWQYVLFDLSNESWSGNVKLITIDFSYQTKNFDEIIYINSVSLLPDINSVLGAFGMPEEQLGYGSSLVLNDSDPVTHEKLNAPDEDSSVSMWFDRTTEKIAQTAVTSGDKAGYTIRMAKNEIEDCQFFLAPETDRTFRVELSDFSDGAGNTLVPSLFFEYYHNVNGIMTPDAIPPVQGAVPVKGGQSQGFIIKVKTTAQTVAGLYGATLNIYDDITEKCVKTAKVYCDIWNFALSDETIMRTSMQMLNWKTYHTYPDGTDTNQLSYNYYDFLLENRICAAELPFGVRDSRSAPYLDNPRVNSFLIPGVEADRHADYTSSVYSIMSSVPGRLEKTYFYRVDEPVNMADLQKLAATGDSLAPYYPDYRMVSPFYVDIDCGDKDMIEYMKPYLDIWCVKMNAFTPRKLSFLPGVSYLQNQAQDAKYGEFTERMEAEKEDGDEVWAYFCFEPLTPYANWMAICDGTEPEITFWQCKLLGVNGVLIWGVNAWTDDMYGNIKSHELGASWGDGILIYSGAPYGINTPVSSLRLESIRDGIEDYQMLCMLEELCGKDAVEEYIRMITTSVVNFTSDDNTLATVRVMLGERLESELNK